MQLPRRLASLSIAATLALAAPLEAADRPAAPGQFQPQVGQAGKDVIWVPTGQPLVDKMLDMAKVTAADHVIDLGSGDGRTVITAAKRSARALGIEYNEDMVELSKRNAQKEGVSGRATFAKADLFESDFSQATVITMFLLPTINLKLRPKILDLKAGTRIVSNTFTMGDWDADETAEVQMSDNDSSYYRTALLWIVPAKVGGAWQSDQGRIAFTQKYQMVTGTVTAGGSEVAIEGGRLRGDAISFTAGGAKYSGRVNGNRISGTVQSGSGTAAWSATRQ